MTDKNTPRQALYQSFKGRPGPCPRCGSELINEYQVYAVATRQGKRMADSLIISGDFGWFCKACPTVVINRDGVGEMLGFQKSGWNVGSEYTVLGIVDLDAVPAGKRHLPIGDPRNPMPLIKFSHTSQTTNRKRLSAPSDSTNRPRRRRKKRTEKAQEDLTPTRSETPILKLLADLYEQHHPYAVSPNREIPPDSPCVEPPNRLSSSPE